MDRSVSALLTGGWTGPAAREYGQAWQEWCRGADEVLAALRRTAELLESTRTTYLSSDNVSQASVQPWSVGTSSGCRNPLPGGPGRGGGGRWRPRRLRAPADRRAR